MKHIYMAIMLALGILLAGCGSDEPQQTQEVVREQAQNQEITVEETIVEDTPSEPAEVQGEDVAPASTNGIVEVELIGKRYEFIPAEIRAKKGDVVRIHATSVDVAHGVRISDYDVNVNMPVGETVDIEFVADKVGEFPYVCSIFCGSGHRDMKGALIVTE